MQQAPNAGTPLENASRERLAGLVTEHGEAWVLKRFNVSRQTLARALGGLGLRRGTRMQFHHGLSTQV
jgi:hypothetical protein